MSTNTAPFIYQDDLGGVLSAPLGTEHIPPMKVPTPAEAPALSANGESPLAVTAPPAMQAGRGLMIWAGASTLALASLGLYAWLR